MSRTFMQLSHILKSQQFDRDLLREIFEIATDMKEVATRKGCILLRGYIMATLFYEPSTRTRLSFETAMRRLGGEVISTENAKQFSSAAKGETLEDTIRVVGGYADIIILRHDEEGAAERAAAVSSVPVINAGDGAGQHPTQALLDLFTIQEDFKAIKGVVLGFMGDPRNSRTTRSLAYLAAKCGVQEMYFIAPPNLQIDYDFREHLKSQGVWVHLTEDPTVVSNIDALYVTRVQAERQDTETNRYTSERYTLDAHLLHRMKETARIYHPLPRINEIPVTIDKDPRAAYFRQAKNGLYVRMALLQMMLGQK